MPEWVVVVQEGVCRNYYQTTAADADAARKKMERKGEVLSVIRYKLPASRLGNKPNQTPPAD